MRLLTILSCLLLVLCVRPLAAQEGQQGQQAEPPDPYAILQAADQALGKLESLGFKVESRGIGSMATRSPATSASAVVRRAAARNPVGWMFRIEGTAQTGEVRRTFTTAYDGRDVRTIREHEKSVITGPWDNSSEPMADGAGFALAWIIRWKELVSAPFGEGGRAWTARHEGTADLDGTLCDVIYVDYSETTDPNLFSGWWYIARADSLPRRVELHLVDHRNGDGFLVTTISDLKPDVAIESAALAPATPAGFEVREAEAPTRVARGRRPSGIPFGEMAPDWTLKDSNGKSHTLSDYRGKVVIMDFWATWCGPCLRAMPGLQSLHEEYKDKGVVIFGINCWESGDPEALMKREGFTYTLLLEGDSVAQMYAVSGIPTFYVISPEGRVAHHAVGFGPQMEEKLTEVIDALLP